MLKIYVFPIFILFSLQLSAMELGHNKEQSANTKSAGSTTVYLGPSNVLGIYYVFLREKPAELLKVGQIPRNLENSPAVQGSRPDKFLGSTIARYLGFQDQDGNLTTPDPNFLCGQLKKLGLDERFMIADKFVDDMEYLRAHSKGQIPLSVPQLDKGAMGCQLTIHDTWNHSAGIFLPPEYINFMNYRTQMLLNLYESLEKAGLEKINGPLFWSIRKMLVNGSAEAADDESANFYFAFADSGKPSTERFAQLILGAGKYRPQDGKASLSDAFRSQIESFNFFKVYIQDDDVALGQPFRDLFRSVLKEVIEKSSKHELDVFIPESDEGVAQLINAQREKIEQQISQNLLNGEKLPMIFPRFEL